MKRARETPTVNQNESIQTYLNTHQQGNIVYVGTSNLLPIKIQVDQSTNYQLPCDMFVGMLHDMKRRLSVIQHNNHVVALSMLKTATCSFLDFEKSFKSLLNNNDDDYQPQLDILRHCAKELGEANSSYTHVLGPTHYMNSMLIESPDFTDLRKVFDQCIKILALITVMINGETHEWSRWKIQAGLVRVSNNALGRLLESLISTTDAVDNVLASHYNEVSCFQKSVHYITDCFTKSEFPDRNLIIQMYTIHEVDMTAYFNEPVVIKRKEVKTMIMDEPVVTTPPTTPRSGLSAYFF